MRVRIVVLNWNGSRWLLGCLAALEAVRASDVEVVLVDNASSDGSLTLVRTHFPWVRVLALSSNTGFARGNNLGAEGATADYLVFLNNDTEVRPGWLTNLVSAADADPAVGLVTSHIVYLDRPDVVDSAGDGYLRCGGAFKMEHGEPSVPHRASREVFGACGAAFLIRRPLFEALGGFDERLFMVYEDVDLSYRARLMGARVVYAAEAVVRHAGSAAIGRMSATAIFYGQRNLEWVWIQDTPTRLLWRSFASHVLYFLASGVAYGRAGHLLTWASAKGAALLGVPAALARRRAVQRTVRVDPEVLWRLMPADWIGRKRREKRIAFGAATPGR